MNTAALDASLNFAVNAVIAAGRHASRRGWAPATAGNFSVRAGHMLAITRTGRDKGDLEPQDVAVVSMDEPLGVDLSAEAALHFSRYAADPKIGAVFHAHIPVAAVLGRYYVRERRLILQGWELQKAFEGVSSHLTPVCVPVFDNDQNIHALAATVEQQLTRATDGVAAPGYLIAGHGVYAWGRTHKDALRHLEAFDMLLTQHLKWLELTK